jgi:hypothetical protein
MKIPIDINNLRSPKAFGYIVGYYMMDSDTYKLNFYETPKSMQLYYNYLDVNERELFIAMACKETGIVVGEWRGDRAIVYEDILCAAPMFYKESVWMFQNGESLRWEIDIEDKLLGIEDELDRYSD